MKRILLPTLSATLLAIGVPGLPLRGFAACPCFTVEPVRNENEDLFSGWRDRLETNAVIDSPTCVYESVNVIAGWMESNLGLAVRRRVEIRVCPLPVPSASRVGSPTGESTAGLFFRDGSEGVLYIRPGLRARRLIQVAAHEWVHAWQSENCPEDQRLVVREGFAQWGVAQLLNHLSLMEDLSTLVQRNDFYGEAYRWTADFERQNGRESLLRAVREIR